MHSQFRAALFVGLLASVATGAMAESLSLDQAIEKAFASAPEIRASDAEIAAAQAGRRQSGVKPNPSLTVESENFVGTGSIGAFRQTEMTVTYSQSIERGGKRTARVALGDSDVKLAQARAVTTRLDIAADVQRAYIDVLIAETAVLLGQDRLRFEREMQTEALRRVRGYKDPLFVETRAARRVAEAELALSEAQRRLSGAQAFLVSFWGGEPGALQLTSRIGGADSPRGSLAKADASVAEASIGRAQSVVIVERTRATPDYSVSGGIRYLPGTNDVAAVASITIPIGRFDRNQGGIERAEAERRQAEYLAEADRLARLRRLASLRADADAALARAEGIMTEVYPRTVKTLEQVRWGYNRGGFRFSDVEDAANAIIAVQASWLDAMTRYRDLQTEIDRLTGRFDVPQAGEINS